MMLSNGCERVLVAWQVAREQTLREESLMHEDAQGQGSRQKGLALGVLLKDSGQNLRMLLLTPKLGQYTCLKSET